MGRVYTASFPPIAVTAIQDLLELTAPSTGMIEVLSARVGQDTEEGDAAAEMLQIAWTRYATSGSAGGSAVVTPHNVGHAASGITAERNNTTQGGTPTIVIEDMWNVQAGYLYVPIPEERIWVPPSGILALELPVAPADPTTISGSITFIEHD